MKKYLILLAVAVCSTTVFAQFANKGGSRGGNNSAGDMFWSSEKPAQTIKTGVHVGLNVANMQEDYPASYIIDNEGNVPSVNPSAGFNIGYDVLYSINKNLGIKTGIELSKKGAKIEYSEKEVDGNYKFENEAKVNVKAFYFEVPITVRYQINFSDELNVFTDEGFYLAFGAFGKSKVDTYYCEEYRGEKDSDSGSEKFNTFKPKFTDKDEDWEDITEFDKGLKRFDFGIKYGIGVSYKQFSLSFNYSLGLMNTLPDKIKVTETEIIDGELDDSYSESISLKDGSLKNRSWAINFGITF